MYKYIISLKTLFIIWNNIVVERIVENTYDFKFLRKEINKICGDKITIYYHLLLLNDGSTVKAINTNKIPIYQSFKTIWTTFFTTTLND